MNELALGFELMAYGITGTFFVLILFYVMIVLLVKLFPYTEDAPENQEDN